jgi:hypothetical protein
MDILSHATLIASHTASEASKLTSKLTTQLVEKTKEFGVPKYIDDSTSLKQKLESSVYISTNLVSF